MQPFSPILDLHKGQGLEVNFHHQWPMNLVKYASALKPHKNPSMLDLGSFWNGE